MEVIKRVQAVKRGENGKFISPNKAEADAAVADANDQPFDGLSANVNGVPTGVVEMTVSPVRFINKSIGDAIMEETNRFATQEYVTRDSGKRQEFPTGMVRDVQEGKLLWSLLCPEVLRRDVELLMRGAKKYSAHNWKKGQPFSRAFESMMRHMMEWWMGDRSEDHLAAIRFNAACLIFQEEMIKTGRLPETLNDMEASRGNP